MNRVHRVHCSAHLDIRHNRFPDGQIKIAIAMDESFNFYYADNLDALRRQKAHLVFFSPVNDSKLPENISGVILGGGFPEVLAERLEKNQSMIKSISKRQQKMEYQFMANVAD